MVMVPVLFPQELLSVDGPPVMDPPMISKVSDPSTDVSSRVWISNVAEEAPAAKEIFVLIGW